MYSRTMTMSVASVNGGKNRSHEEKRLSKFECRLPPNVPTKTRSSRKKIPSVPPAGGTASLEAPRLPGKFRRFLKILGPGLITGASDDDPSGIGTYAIAGASFGFSTLWMALVTLPMMSSVQYMCAKIGMVSGRGLAGVLKTHYPKKFLYPAVLALVVANAINAGADVGAIAAGVNLLLPVPVRTLIVPIGIVVVALQIWCSYQFIAKTFKWLTFALLAYVLSAFFSKPDWIHVLRGTFLPTFPWNREFLALTVAILGTTISPYMFFWQSNQEVEEQIAIGRKTLAQRKGATDGELTYAALDVNIGMLVSNVVMYFIILSTGATLFKSGNTHIQSATDAAAALRPLAGRGAEALLAIGLIGAGFLAVPILTGSSAYAVAETFGWKHGLDRRPSQAKAFYGLIALSTFLGMLINFTGINPVSALFWTAVINGFLAPPLLVLIIMISNNPKVMGNRVNSRLLNTLGCITAAVMAAAAFGLIATWGQ
jgi:NRAMP (natural resistance-associated macrophage protein)-like metal ion transporter